MRSFHQFKQLEREEFVQYRQPMVTRQFHRLGRLGSLLFCGALTIILPNASAQVDHNELDCSPLYQIRIYEIPEQNRQAFHDRFRTHAARIMSRYEFDILAMWESQFDGALEFVYLLKWPDRETKVSRWDAFMADEEWARIKAETGAVHGQFVNDIEDRALCLTDYSPDRVD